MKHKYHKMPGGKMMKDSDMKSYKGKSFRKGIASPPLKLEDVLKIQERK